VTRYRPTVVEVDLDAIRHNVRLLTPPDAELMAIVKADGYGLGAVPVSRAALEAGASRLGVALVEEGLSLREAGIGAPILVLTEFPPGSEKEAIEAGLTPSVYSDDGLERLAEAGRALGRPVGVHLKVDTGMHRVGVWPPEEAPAFARRILDAGLEIEGAWTHFADSERDDEGTRTQLALFRNAVDALAAEGIRPAILHAANSGATIRLPETHLDLVRPGAAVYGIDPGEGIGEAAGMRPALAWRSAVATVKRLPAGVQDGTADHAARDGAGRDPRRDERGPLAAHGPSAETYSRGTRAPMPVAIARAIVPARAASSSAVTRSSPWAPISTTSSPGATSASPQSTTT